MGGQGLWTGLLIAIAAKVINNNPCCSQAHHKLVAPRELVWSGRNPSIRHGRRP